MKKSLTKREKEVLNTLIENSKLTDTQIAKRLKTSRPTISKIRSRLENEAFILKYSAQPNYTAVGMKLHALILFRWVDYSKKKELEETIQYIRGLEQVQFFMKGEGMENKSMSFVSTHTNLASFEKFINELKEKWADNVDNISTFISTSDGLYKPFTFSNI